ncbi:ABC transporter substrate-binding protein [Pseudothermotoga thermarum]|uniref:NMT1/THI5-like domain-containing protein n=1 Tax=Pseudothermotoga thermarum DSM 5069 TaxID=688269 RepID=F7YVM2_9THEM|nr:ABC transporter substrate-binding protein [Pseudothermotoga thermarum]AEH51683.1 NMT1/THI5-like domain-containing protein [Pseudothermotoga thermarum DSM 5069]
MKKFLAISMLIFSLLIFGQKVTVILDWYPNTNHTGLYVALEKGYFKEENLEVSIVQPLKLSTEQLVAAGNGEFGISFQEFVTYARAEGLPIVSIAAIIQHNTSGFAWLKGTMSSPKDWEGKTYGGWGTELEVAILKTIAKKYGIDPNKIKIQDVGQLDFVTGLRQRVFDFQWVYYGWEVIGAKVQGVEVDFVFLKDIDEVFDYYTPVIITSEKIVQESPELVRKFLRAVQKGYLYAVENPVESAKILLKYAPELDEKLVIESQKFLSTKYIEDAPRWGYQDPKVWRRLYQWMKENGLVGELDIDKAYTNEFLP